MNKPDPTAIRVHKDRAMFLEAVNFTAAQTGFSPRLIEKDYFCTVLLRYLATSGMLVFKGGTCMAKVHAEFYRLSEDLDFAIPMPCDAMRAERSRQAKKLKKTVAELAAELEGFTVVEPLTGANVSTQYVSVVGYDSVLSGQAEGIKIEIGLREPLLTPAFDGAARTALLDPVSGRPMVPPVAVRCISRMEAFAEKFRAALSRREAAIRDFYDIDYAVRRLDLRPQDPTLVELVRQKLAMPGNEPADVSEARLATLRRQLDAQLKPVLRDRDFAEFDLERAFRTVARMAEKTR
ncbi:MAG TPA: nucleotidyl transferase AbiEii/AbiGii toxin family protein [Sedimentisphaerales bacterium]|nr:nucleotidyl transferase AbiEii/AbiGii toxin family protein [Sedimentisphaerales bacterium]HRS11586.1 nucleotidyl transferase AbiEii/AbiGii toxin family protein [Sedimentisphaerales bacterium]HRV48249.1 nucleotidyl transferase AbiEii/AbiGii toxin family protein [Sedimentisphaerales bacterium]